jgi:hypothetical protein
MKFMRMVYSGHSTHYTEITNAYKTLASELEKRDHKEEPQTGGRTILNLVPHLLFYIPCILT